jgi:aspartate/methionine/tyrosine aminotransferase
MIAETAQHELLLARRMSRLGTETAFEVLSKAKALERQGRSIIHLEIGEPDFDTPGNVVEAAVDALRKGWTHYGPARSSRRRPWRQAHHVFHHAGPHR